MYVHTMVVRSMHGHPKLAAPFHTVIRSWNIVNAHIHNRIIGVVFQKVFQALVVIGKDVIIFGITRIVASFIAIVPEYDIFLNFVITETDRGIKGMMMNIVRQVPRSIVLLLTACWILIATP